MKHWVLVAALSISLLPAFPAQANSTMARLQFEDAEIAYSEKRYAEAIAKLSEAEKLFGRANPPMIHLRIMARHDMIRSDPFYAFSDLERLRIDCAGFLKDFADNPTLLDQVREIHKIGEGLRQLPPTRSDYASTMEKQLRNLYLTNRNEQGNTQLSRLQESMPEEGTRWSTLAAEALAAWQQRLASYVQRAMPEMVAIPAGTSHIGGYIRDRSEPIREISFNPFAISKYEITYDQYDAFAEATNRGKPAAPWGRGRMPVVYVTHQDAAAFANWLKGTTGKNWRLLSEAEWEYAARRGQKRPRANHFFCTEGRFAQQQDRCGNDQKPVPVGSYKPDSWMHDALGNVKEHVADCWNDNYQRAPMDQSAWLSGDCAYRVIRGGDFLSVDNGMYEMSPTARNKFQYGYYSSQVGFRVGFDM